MTEEGKSPSSPAAADAQLFGLLSTLLQQVESLTNQEEVELRAKIEALGLEVRKLPPKSAQHLNQLDNVDEMISSAMATDPQVRALLSTTADVWMPVITATSDERRNFTSVPGEDDLRDKGKGSA
ncbi:pleckstrin homology (PH) domain-containing protein [Striga asiatica]|uniref:Pleckstrin homology (PH) domain-containing protein n=1 Tax=Striga asiatica TaxID=4170 RepID=A0A5A7RJP0_STRAF|nr:pleckstrin homology (PH) domain-containing protein [Striga asiatica]